MALSDADRDALDKAYSLTFRRLQDDLDTARAKLHQAAADAYDDGLNLTEVAYLLNVSRTTAHGIISRRAKVRPKGRVPGGR